MKKINIKFFLFLTLILTLLLPSYFAKAQTATGGIQSHMVTLSINPIFPKPNTAVDISASTDDFDIADADVSWFVDGVEAKSGKGLSQVFVISPMKGRIMKIDVVATYKNKKAAGYIDIKSGDLTVLWESDSYTPPFYRGKALAPIGGLFRAIAIPELYKEDNTKYSSSDLYYNWSINESKLGDSSGKGKNSAYMLDKTFSEAGNIVSVSVSLPNKAYISKELGVPHSNPLIIFYPKDNLLGTLFHKAIIDDYVSNDPRITIITSPYFFSNKNGPKHLTWDWTIDNKNYPDYSNELVFDTSLFTKDSTVFNVNITSPESPMQARENSFNYRHYPNLATE